LDAILHTERLALRPIEPRDAPLLWRYVVENREWLRPWEPVHPPHYYTLEGQRSILYQCEDDRRAETGILLGLYEKGRATGELCGRISVAGIVRGIWMNGFVGYSVTASRAGRGYMTEALRRICEYGFVELGLHRLQVSIIPRNEPSLRVARKCRFRHEGRALGYLRINEVWEDHDIFAMTEEEYAAHRAQPEPVDQLSTLRGRPTAVARGMFRREK
jgi:ribosomal-protein-alanine N-acetyltransferase